MDNGRRNSHQQIAWILLIVIVGTYLLMAIKFPHAYIIATYEDLVGEWTQVFLFASTMLLAGRQAYCSSRFRPFFALLALACLYVVGEEISWGQRLFDIPTPEFFNDHNLQGETNLHNFLTGPISTLTKQGIEIIVAAGLLGYGLLYPWLLRMRNRAALWLERLGLPGPPLYLSHFFVLSAIFELGLIHFNEAEIAEILIPFALAMMTLNYRLSARQQLAVDEHNSWGGSHSKRLAGQTLLVFVGAVGLALVTTLACYSSPRLGAEMSNRYYNGIEKFAGRYQRMEQWDTATRLYLEAQQREPYRASLRRNLFRCYEQLGQPEEARQHLDNAIESDLQRLVDNPNNIAARISLVRTYQMIDDVPKMQQYLQQALAVGLAEKTVDPKNPATAYWLGSSYEFKGDYPAALREFERAVNLQPEYLRYRKALLAVSRLVSEHLKVDKS